MNNLQGVAVEKVASKAFGQTIYLGDGICWSLNNNKIDTYNANTVDVNTRMEYIFGYKNYWAILRPSMNFS